MAYADELDPTESVLSFFANDLRRRRENAGISQRELAKRAHMAPSLLNKIEATKRLPTKDLAVLCDETFGTGDHFQRLWPLVVKHAYPSWFRPFVELERSATVIRSFQVQFVPGLLQTEDYARAVLSAGRADKDRVDDLASARIERQHVLRRETPPRLWVVLDENVLRRRVGDPETMRAQLEHLINASEIPSNVIQIVPIDTGAHAGMGGPFAVLTLDEGPQVVYADGFLQGQILAEPEHVTEALRTYDLLVADALSPSRSIDLIARVLKDLRS